MIFYNKKIVIIGDRDGVSSPAIEACIKSSEKLGEIVYSVTVCYSCSLGGAVDEVLSEALLTNFNQYGCENVAVIIGGGDIENNSITAQTIYELAESCGSHGENNKVGINVYHAMENIMVEQYNEEVYEDKIGVLAYVLDLPNISREMEKIRNTFV